MGKDLAKVQGADRLEGIAYGIGSKLQITKHIWIQEGMLVSTIHRLLKWCAERATVFQPRIANS